jgi:hypothetical protein
MARSKVKKLFFSAILLLLDPRYEIRGSEIQDPGSWIWDRKNQDPESGISTPDPQHSFSHAPFHGNVVEFV